jgi:dethiobiotin synthetase
MAADVLGRPAFDVRALVDELDWPQGVEVGMVETAGGVRSPIASDGDATQLAIALAPDLVVLVADAGLGTINAVRLAMGALDATDAVVVLNRFDARDDLHVRNRRWLADVDGYDVVTSVGALVERIRSISRARPRRT